MVMSVKVSSTVPIEDKIIKWIIIFICVLITCLLLSILHPANTTAYILVGKEILSPFEATSIVAAAEDHAIVKNSGVWDTERHQRYPTTDFSIYSLDSSIVSLWNNTLRPRVLGIMASHIPAVPDGDMEYLSEEDVFVVKYDSFQQKGIAPHRDRSHLSFNIALNNDEMYKGGGTHMLALKKTYNIKIGDVLMHSSGIVHSGVDVSVGTRYILVGFVNIKQYVSSPNGFFRMHGFLSVNYNISEIIATDTGMDKNNDNNSKAFKIKNNYMQTIPYIDLLSVVSQHVCEILNMIFPNVNGVPIILHIMGLLIMLFVGMGILIYYDSNAIATTSTTIRSYREPTKYRVKEL